MLQVFLRQRRRFAFALIVTQIALLHTWPETMLFAAITVTLSIGFVVASATTHPIRRLVECGAVGLAAATCVTSAPPLAATTFVGVTGLAYILLYTPVLDALPFRVGLRSRKKFQVNLDRRTTWNKLIPGEAHPAAYWTGTMLAARTDPHDEETLYATFDGPNGPEEATITFLKRDNRTTAQYLVERDTFVTGEEVMISYQLAKITETSTSIRSEMRVSGLPIRHAVERFFDDVMGDELDSFAIETMCKRSWDLRGSHEIELTSELGRENVTLKLDLSVDAAADDPVDFEHVAQRMSA